jgi:hypothetical protein
VQVLITKSLIFQEIYLNSLVLTLVLLTYQQHVLTGLKIHVTERIEHLFLNIINIDHFQLHIKNNRKTIRKLH